MAISVLSREDSLPNMSTNELESNDCGTLKWSIHLPIHLRKYTKELGPNIFNTCELPLSKYQHFYPIVSGLTCRFCIQR